MQTVIEGLTPNAAAAIITNYLQHDIELTKRDLIVLGHLTGSVKKLIIDIARLSRIYTNFPSVKTEFNRIHNLSLELAREISEKIADEINLEQLVAKSSLAQANVRNLDLARLRALIGNNVEQLDTEAERLLKWLAKMDRLPQHREILQDMRTHLNVIIEAKNDDKILSTDILSISTEILNYEERARRIVAARR